jgi:hypothetical protein
MTPDIQKTSGFGSLVNSLGRVMAMESWSTHRWLPPLGRVLEIKGRTLKHFQCEVCKRDFVEEIESGERYAVNVGTFNFERLSNEVTDQWLGTPCRDHPPVDEEEDRRKTLTDFEFSGQKPQPANKISR